MRLSFILLTAGAIFFGSGNAVQTQQKLTSSDVVALSEVVNLDKPNKRSLRSNPVVDINDEENGEEKVVRVPVKSINALVDVKKLDAALGDLTKRKALFKLWNADAAVSKQVIDRLSTDRLVFAKYSPLVLTYNVYRMQRVSRAAAKRVQIKTIDQLVDPTVLNAALKDRAVTKALFKRWNADESIAIQAVNRIAADPIMFDKYSELILKFNAYRTIPLRNAAKSAATRFRAR